MGPERFELTRFAAEVLARHDRSSCAYQLCHPNVLTMKTVEP